MGTKRATLDANTTFDEVDTLDADVQFDEVEPPVSEPTPEKVVLQGMAADMAMAVEKKPAKQGDVLNSIYSKYPKLKNLGEVTIKADPSFTRDATGGGSIEYFGKDQDTIRYKTGLNTPHPKKGTHGIVYDPKTNSEEDIMLDMLHGMADADPKYKALRDKFEQQTLKDRRNDIEYFYKKDLESGNAPDGKDWWIKNYIDGLVRSEVSESTTGDYAMERKGNSPAMKKIASELKGYLQSQDIKGGFTPANPKNTVDVTVYKDVNGKPVKQSQPETIMADGSKTMPISQLQNDLYNDGLDLQWSGGKPAQTIRTESERIGNTRAKQLEAIDKRKAEFEAKVRKQNEIKDAAINANYSYPTQLAATALRGLSPMVSEASRSVAILANQLDDMEGNFFNDGNDKKVTDYATYKFAEMVGKWAEELPVTTEVAQSFVGKLVQGGAQLAGIYGAGIAGRALKGVSVFGKVTPTVMATMAGVTQMGGSEYKAAYDRISDAHQLPPQQYIEKYSKSDSDPNVLAAEQQELQQKDPEQSAFNSFLINGAIGVTEAIPVMGWLNRVNKATGGQLAKTYARHVAQGATKGFLEEGVQEAVQTWAANATARQIYDTTRELTDGVLEAGTLGGILGGTVNTLTNMVTYKLQKATDPKEIEVLQATQGYLNEIADETKDAAPNDILGGTITSEKVVDLEKQKAKVEQDMTNEELPADVQNVLFAQSQELQGEIDAVKEADKESDKQRLAAQYNESIAAGLDKMAENELLSEESRTALKDKAAGIRKQYTIEAPKIKTEEVAKSEPIELSVEKTDAFEKGSEINWDVFGNEESGKWIVGEKVKTRGGKDAVVLSKIYVESSIDGKTYSKEYADANGIKYDNEHTVEHIVPISELSITSETKPITSEVVEPVSEAPVSESIVETKEFKNEPKGKSGGAVANVDLTKAKLNYHVSKSPQGVQGEVRFGNGLHGKGFYTASDKSKVPFSGDSEQFIILTKKPFEENWKNNYRDKGSDDDVRTKALLSEGYDTIKTGDYEIAIGSPKQVIKIEKETTYNDILKQATEYFGNENDAIGYLKSKGIEQSKNEPTTSEGNISTRDSGTPVKEQVAKESAKVETTTQETNAPQSKVDVTTLKKNDEFYSGGEKFKFIAKEPDGRITVRTSSGSTYTADAAKFSDARVENGGAEVKVEKKGEMPVVEKVVEQQLEYPIIKNNKQATDIVFNNNGSSDPNYKKTLDSLQKHFETDKGIFMMAYNEIVSPTRKTVKGVSGELYDKAKIEELNDTLNDFYKNSKDKTIGGYLDYKEQNAPATRTVENKGVESNEAKTVGKEVATNESVGSTPKTNVEQVNSPKSEAPPSAEKGQVKPKLQFERNTEKIEELKNKFLEIGRRSLKNTNMGSNIADTIEGVKIAIQIGYYKAEDIAKFFIEQGANNLVPYIKDALNHIRENEDMSDEVRASLEGKEMKEKAFMGRAHRSKAAMNNEQLKQSIAAYGLTYEVEHQVDARQAANDLINEIGIENALMAAEKGLFPEDSAAPVYIYQAAIDDKLAKARTAADQDLKNALYDEATSIANDMDLRLRGAGRRISAIYDVYKTSDLGYSLVAIRSKALVANKGKELTQAQRVEFDELAERFQKSLDEIAAHKEKIAALEAEIEFKNIAANIEKTTKAKRSKADIKKELDAARAQFRKDMGQMSSGGLQALTSFTKVVSLAVEYGIKTAAQFYKEFKSDFKGYTEDEIKAAFNAVNDIEPKAPPAPIVGKDGKLVLSDALVNSIVKEGLESGNIKSSKEKIADVEHAASLEWFVDKVYETLTPEQQQQFTKRNVKDAISKYGKAKYPSADKLKAMRRELNRDLQLAAGLEDVLLGKRPSKSGAQRDKPTDQQRGVMKRIKDLLKDFPEDEVDVERKFATAQDRITSYLENRIADLNRQIAEGKRDERNETPLQYSDKNKALKAQVDELAKALDDLVGKKELTHEQKVKNAIAAVERAEAEYQRRIDLKDFDTRQKLELTDPDLKAAKDKLDAKRKEYNDLKQQERPDIAILKATENALNAAKRTYDKLKEKVDKKQLAYDKKQSKVVETPALKAAREANKTLRETLKKMREESGVAEARRLELWKKRAAKYIKDNQEKLDKGTVALPEPRKVLELDEEGRRLAHEKEKVKMKIDVELEKLRLANRTDSDIVYDWTVNIANMFTSMVTTLDLSAGGRQGIILGAAHPKLFAESFIEQLKMFGSAEYDRKWYAALHNSDLYVTMKHHGLYLGEKNAGLMAREEQWTSDIPEKIWGYGVLARASSRAYNGMLNNLRVKTFTDFYNAAIDAGLTGKELDAELEAVARFINHTTGRGDLPNLLKGAAPILNGIMFSPRFAASRAQLIATALAIPYNGTIGKATRALSEKAGHKITGFEWANDISYNSTPRARKEAIRSMLIYTTSVLSLLALVKLYSRWNDDDEVTVETDLRSSDALKVRIGNVRYDFGAGLLQWIVLFSRLATASKKDQDIKLGGDYYEGEVKSLYGKGAKGSMLGMMGDFMENKASPPFSMALQGIRGVNKRDNTFMGYEEPFGYDLGKRGETVNPIGILAEAPIPFWIGDIKDIYQEQPAIGASLSTSANILGLGVNIQEDASEKYYVPKGASAKLLNENNILISRLKPTEDDNGVSGVTIQGTHIPLTKEQSTKVDAEMEKILTGLLEEAMYERVKKKDIEEGTGKEKIVKGKSWPVLSGIVTKKLLQEQISEMKEFAKEKAVKEVLGLDRSDYKEFEKESKEKKEAKEKELKNAR